MAILSIDTSERGLLLGFNFMFDNTNASNIQVQSAVFRTGGYALQSNPAGANIGWVGYGKLGDPSAGASSLTNRDINSFGAAITSVFARVYFQWVTKPAANNEEIMSVVNNNTGGGPMLIVVLRSDQKLELINSAGASVGVGATVLAASTWYRIELNSNTGAAGAYELRIEGVTELSGTTNQTAINPAMVVLGKRANRNGQTVNFYYDDFLSDSTDWPGPGRVLNMKPNANGTFAQWTAGTGASDWTQVDEIPPDDDTSYIKNPGGASNEVSTFFFNPAGISGVIKAVQPWIAWRREAGTVASSTIRLISAATTVNLTVTNINTVYRTNYSLFLLDPATGLPWKKSALAALQAGPLMVSDTGPERATTVGILVAFDDEAGGRSPLLPLLGAG